MAILKPLKSSVARGQYAIFVSCDEPAFRRVGISTFDSLEGKVIVTSILSNLNELAKTEVSAMRCLARLYDFGVGVDRNSQRSFELNLLAATKDPVFAGFNVGYAYLYGLSVKQDIPKGLQYMNVSASKGNSSAMIVLALLYKDGVGVPKNESIGNSWYDKAARAGNIDAMLTCAIISLNRTLRAASSKDKSFSKYMENYYSWLNKAVDLGDTNAMQLLLATERSDNLGRPDEAYALAERAAKSGTSFSLLALAACKMEGWGCPIDRVKADEILASAMDAAKREHDDARTESILEITRAEGDEKLRLLITRLKWPEKNAAVFKKMEMAINPPLFSVKSDSRTEKMKGQGQSDVRPPGVRPVFELIDSNLQVSSSGNYVSVQGRVKNVSSQPVGETLAKVIYLDANGKLVLTSKAVVSPNPVEPGQIGTFESADRSDPRISSYELHFEKFGGAAIPTKLPR